MLTEIMQLKLTFTLAKAKLIAITCFTTNYSAISIIAGNMMAWNMMAWNVMAWNMMAWK